DDYYQVIEEGGTPSESSQEREGESKGNSIKWLCPNCYTSVRSTTKNININCGDCDMAFEISK
ncbi:hypothetical protein JUJ52_20145, partial [Virgibacillus sp. AGTR]|nr:hypothetical protein [Virgibacillus sp. AGTR]